MRPSETLEDEPWLPAEAGAPGEPAPGLVLIFSADRPACEVIPLESGAIELGRGEVAGVRVEDRRMSRRHARVAFEGGLWRVVDGGSRNGTAVDGAPIEGERCFEAPRVLRTGASLFLLATDTRPFCLGVARAGDTVMGPALQRALRAIARVGQLGRVVHITGESGSGKERAARAFHDAGPASAGPLVAVNSAALPEGMAERLLFGACKGAYTGAVDAPGLLQRAHGGTLFLDEVAELDLGAQAKLLRVLETGEVLRLGASRGERVDIRICSATHKDLRAQVASGRMREDLFFRIGVPAVALPPLRDRLEEIPWLIERAVQEVSDAAGGLRPQVSLVEACLLRRWPGNVRELLAEVRAAAQLAADDGGAVLAAHLGPNAGRAMVAATAAPAGSAPPAPEPPAPPPPAPTQRQVPNEVIAEALRAADGSVSQAARALGMHRTQIYRWMAREGHRPVKNGRGPNRT